MSDVIEYFIAKKKVTILYTRVWRQQNDFYENKIE